MAHKESCKKCKTAFLKALTKEFGEVTEQWKSGWPCRIDEILSIPQITKATALSLEKIYKALQDHRGHHDFVGRQKLPRCDYYIKSLNCIVEFDESQHFTSPRALTLSLYPRGLKLGHDRKVWLNRCQELDRHDNDTADRDEKRAWYDTLRDILPVTFGMRPTNRVFAKEMIWCEDNIEEIIKIIKWRDPMNGKQKKKTNKIDFSCVTVAHVRKAINKFKKDPKRKARSTEIRNNCKDYPAKQILGEAYLLATNITLDPNDYTGGDVSAKVLHNLGFDIKKNGNKWEPRSKKQGMRIFRIFLRGEYKRGEHNGIGFLKWVSKNGGVSPERLKAIFTELGKLCAHNEKCMIVFPACTLVYKKGQKGVQSRNKLTSILRKNSKNSILVIGVFDKIKSSNGKEYISVWNNGKESRHEPYSPDHKLPVGDGCAFISSNIWDYEEYGGQMEYCFDIGHGAYTDYYGRTLEPISKNNNLTIIVTSWHKSIPGTYWIYMNGEKLPYKMKPVKTEIYNDLIDEIKIPKIKKLFE